MSYNKKILKVVPYGGLCNRLLFLNSIVKYAQDHNYSVNCYWFMNKEIYADLNDLFVIRCDFINFIIIDTKSISGYICQIAYKVLRKLNVLILNQLKLYDSKNMERSSIDFVNHIDDRLIITGCMKFYNEFVDNVFSPKQKYINEASRVIKTNTKTAYISMHIRRTDHIESMRVTTDEKVYKVIGEIINSGGDNKIFLACDDLSFKDKIISQYKDYIFSQNVKSTNRNNFQAIEFALIDLICLSKGKRIYGSYTSSFSEFAAVLGSKKLQIII